jgi:hypothetical protein
MTWYAHHIFAQADQRVIDHFIHHPVLSQRVYWVRNLDDHLWPTPDIQHLLSPNGVVIVRPVGERDPDGEAEMISWHQISSDTDISLHIPPAVLQADNSNISAREAPPLPFLQFLKSVSRTTECVIAYYYCCMWAGEVDVEYSYVYTPEETAYANKLEPTSPASFYRYQEAQPRQESIGDVVVETLKHFDCYLPTVYFAPHTRSFPWERYRVVPNP